MSPDDNSKKRPKFSAILGRFKEPLALVPILGAVGGITALVLQGTPPAAQAGASRTFIEFAKPLATYMFLGAIAATIFVFLISNTDRQDVARLCAVALVAGLAWKPVLEAGQNLIIQRAVRNEVLAHVDRAEVLIQDATRVADIEEKEALTLEAAEKIDTAIIEAARLQRPADRAVIGKALESLQGDLIEKQAALPAKAVTDLRMSLKKRALIPPFK